MNCAVYIRKSRETTDKPSYRLTVQREQLPVYAKAQCWSVEIYDDGHASAARGKAEHLPERSRLEADIRSGKINVILVIELSRLSRDDTMQDYVAWLTLCADHSVKLSTLTRNLDPSQNSDWMLLLMEGGFSSVEMKVLAGRMAEGRRQAFIAGKFLGGQVPKPYRYDKSERKPTIDATLIDDCEKIWLMAETMSAKAIAEKMDLAEITVRRMISDSRLLFYQAQRIDPETGETIACDWESVMSSPRAERIRAGRRTRKTNNVRRDAAGLLSALGIFYCGYCSKTVKSWNNSKIRLDGTRLDYYACVTKNKKGACPKSKMIDHKTVNEKVIRNLLSTLAQGELLRSWWKDAQEANVHNDNSAETIAEIKKEELKKQNLVAAIAEGLLEFSDAKKQMEIIKSKMITLQDRLDQQAAKPEQEPEWDTLQITADEFKELTNLEQREVITNTITAITLYNSYAIIKYRFPRTKSGSYEARANLTRGKEHVAKMKNRTRLQVVKNK